MTHELITSCHFLILYSGKSSYGAKFRIFHIKCQYLNYENFFHAKFGKR